MTIKKLIPNYIFEASWEVCNKVGGIYTVLSTRANSLQTLFKDKIVFIGPDIWKGKSNPDFIENASLFKSWRDYAETHENLSVRAGRWNVPGQPVVILVDFQACFDRKNDLYASMWQQFGVDSLHAYGDYDESCMFAYAAGLAIESFHTFFDLQKQHVVAHFNEWMLGMGVLYVRSKLPGVATLFTTHATSIGRSIAGNGKCLYAYFHAYNGDRMAQELNMTAKHSVEKQAAHYADCFTTVSHITAKECEQLLEKKPDIVTPNGFENDFVPPRQTYSAKRKAARKKLIETAEKLTGQAISGDALLISTSGRYEYRNKGIDIFIGAVDRLRQSDVEKDVVAFILVPGWIDGARNDLQRRLESPEQATQPLPDPYITHVLHEPASDKISAYLNAIRLTNSKNEKVKLVFVPSYLTGNDGIFNLPYYDLLIGMDLTVYPSYYEPWGYTPLESIAFSVPTITTGLSGFGLWAKQQIEPEEEGINSGVEVIERRDDNEREVIEKIAAVIADRIKQPSKTIARSRKAAAELADKASWDHFISYYLEAYHIALKKANERKNNSYKICKQ
jgi:glycogen synthase